jgi:hypothetical protein
VDARLAKMISGYQSRVTEALAVLAQVGSGRSSSICGEGSLPVGPHDLSQSETLSPAGLYAAGPMRRWSALLLCLSLGCAKQLAPLDASVLKARNMRTIGVVASPASLPEFQVQRQNGAVPMQSMGLMLALAIVAIQEMNDQGPAVEPTSHSQPGVNPGRVADPSSRVARQLAAVLASKHGLTFQTPKQHLVGPDLRWDTDLVLQVSTKKWGMSDSPADSSHFRTYYVAELELRAGRDGDLIVSGECTMPLFIENPRGSPTYDQLMARNAALLKKRLAEEVDSCAQELSRKFLGIRLADDRTPEDQCHLYGTPAWEAADGTERRRLLHDCWDRRAREAKTPAPAAPGTPAASTPSRATAPAAQPPTTGVPSDGPS